MKKIFYILASAIVALGAIACENEGLENVAPEVNGTETLSFTATIDNTKTALEGLKTIWVKGDVVMIDTYEFVCQEDLATFTCTGLTEEQVATLKEAETLTATYSKNNDGKVDSAAGVAGAVLQAEGNFSDGFNFSVKSAFLKFTTNENVTLVGEGLFNNLAASYTGTDVYVAVNAGVNADFSYSVYGITQNTKNTSFEAGKIYNVSLPTKTYVFVEDDSTYSDLYLYLYDSTSNNTWPGQKYDGTTTYNGVEYKYFEVADAYKGNKYTYIFNDNNSSQVEEGKTLTLDGNKFLWLTKKYTKELTAANTGNTEPATVYALQWDWNNWTNICCYMWIEGGAHNAAWSGVAMTAMGNTKYNGKSYYYYEASAAFNGKSNVNFIINGLNNSIRKQTNDITGKAMTKDWYVKLSGSDGGSNFTVQNNDFASL